MSQENHIKVKKNGPVLCTGEIEVYAADGYLFTKSDNVALCRCGHSRNRPFCDGSHKQAGFEHDGIVMGVESVELEGEGPLIMTVSDSAGIIVKGPMTITSGDGSFSTTRNETVLCRCGHSGNKPFCDNSHKEFNLEG